MVLPELTPLVSGQPTSRTLLILMADEDSDAADSLAPLLELIAGEEVVAYKGFAVVPVAERFGLEVCVLDVRMPGINGWEIARRLRTRVGGRRLFLVAVHEVLSRESVGDSTEAGFDARLLLKPSDSQEVYQALADFIERSLFPPTIDV